MRPISVLTLPFLLLKKFGGRGNPEVSANQQHALCRPQADPREAGATQHPYFEKQLDSTDQDFPGPGLLRSSNLTPRNLP